LISDLNLILAVRAVLLFGVLFWFSVFCFHRIEFQAKQAMGNYDGKK